MEAVGRIRRLVGAGGVGYHREMDFAYTEEDEAFRAELTLWLDDHLPAFLEKWAEVDGGQGAEMAGVRWQGVGQRLAQSWTYGGHLHGD